ncbi:MBL fold metallo-hydrolase [Algivirga pacifica]|uniref:MBL fold metallo-hydrolase n=2 Tax=Algivirga pacifica TaxID=1162670 RepID=A0ABP9DEI3_9BACT
MQEAGAKQFAKTKKPLGKRVIKGIGWSVLALLGIVLIVGTLFLNLSPQFGGTATAEQIVRYEESGHYQEGIFVNQEPTSVGGPSWDLINEMLFTEAVQAPEKAPEVISLDPALVAQPDSITRLTWFGHSAFLLEIEGKHILLDPMLGDTPSPAPLPGPKRFSRELPIEIEELPYIDAVVISHDHYDHLDYESILQMKDKVGAFFTPLGVGIHLEAWGIETDKIHELNWWESYEYKGLTLVSTPSRHFSGRGLLDRFKTFWSSWVIKGEKENIFFSGDGGYGTHFKEIGEKYGPFDIAMMECGQYNTHWKEIHMMPEETVQATLDVKGKLLLPIHWGAFTLSLHDWREPVIRASKKAKELNVPMTTPKIGETITFDGRDYPVTRWWEEY